MKKIIILTLLTILVSACTQTITGSCQQPQTDYQEAIQILNQGNVIQITQTHALCIDITLKNETVIHTEEPVIDDIFKKIQECGDPCKDIIIATE